MFCYIEAASHAAQSLDLPETPGRKPTKKEAEEKGQCEEDMKQPLIHYSVPDEDIPGVKM